MKTDIFPQQNKKTGQKGPLRAMTIDRWEKLAVFATVFSAAAFVFWVFDPTNVFTNTTTTGGDTGAQIWGPDYIRDNLFSSFPRFFGWTNDWFGGMPAFTFYMIPHHYFIALLSFIMPASIAFKIGNILPVVLLPVAVYYMGRLAGLKFPAPALMSVFSLIFIMDSHYAIWGGNIFGTIVGEVSYGMGFMFCVLYIACALGGMETGKYRIRSMIFLALAVLSHPIAGMFAILASFCLPLASFGKKQLLWLAGVTPVAALLSAFWVLPFILRSEYWTDFGWTKAGGYLEHLFRSDWWWLLMLAFAGLWISIVKSYKLGKLMGLMALGLGLAYRFVEESTFLANRLLPFYYFAITILAALAISEVIAATYRSFKGEQNAVFPKYKPKKILIALLLLFIVEIIVLVYAKGILYDQNKNAEAWSVVANLFYFFIGGTIIAAAVCFVIPAWMARKNSNQKKTDKQTNRKPLGIAYLLLAGVSVILAVAIPHRLVGWLEDDRYGLHVAGLQNVLTTDSYNFGRAWSTYNFRGYEKSPANEYGGGWEEYSGIINMMDNVGKEHGCGRSLWEYANNRQTSYGTSFSRALLPYWTDGCITAASGLYSESSSSSPYYYLSLSGVSYESSEIVSGLKYPHLNLTNLHNGVLHLQKLGVRYYLVQNPMLVQVAHEHPDLTMLDSYKYPEDKYPDYLYLEGDQLDKDKSYIEVNKKYIGADSLYPDWIVFEVAASDVIEPLKLEPVVLDTGNWLEETNLWMLDYENLDKTIIADGPDNYQKIYYRSAENRAQPEVKVSEVSISDERISFKVDKTSIPILVKISYFPNWSVKGAEGPYRASPNWMVVIPTEETVVLEYGWTSVEYVGYGLTALGIIIILLILAFRINLYVVRKQGVVTRKKSAKEARKSLPAEGGNSLSIVLPAYNPGQQASRSVARLRKEFAGAEIILVDDGSRDKGKACSDAGADRVICFERNRGKGAAVKEGVLSAQGEIIVYTDIDLAYLPEQIKHVIEEIQNGADAALGNRFTSKDKPVSRKWGSRLISLLTRLLAANSLPSKGSNADIQCGLKAFRKGLAHKIFSEVSVERFAFDVEVFCVLKLSGAKYVEVPVFTVESSESTVRIFSDGMRFVQDLLIIRDRLKKDVYGSVLQTKSVQGLSPIEMEGNPARQDLQSVTKAYDIRGVVPDELNADMARRFGFGFGRFFGRDNPGTRQIICGRDMRLSGEELQTAFMEGALASGMDVVDIGLSSTDMMYFASGHLDLPGIVFTASHNPARYNGIKACRKGAGGLGLDSGLKEAGKLGNGFDPSLTIPGISGKSQKLDVLQDYKSHVLALVDILSPLKVVADAANGMAAMTLPAVFAELPVELDLMYGVLDGSFPNHPADPLVPENQQDLMDRVLKTGADLGLAFDGDGDRVFIVDDKGQPLSGSLTTSLIADYILRRNPGEIVLHNLICSKAVSEIIAERGGKPQVTRVGHSYIKETMSETGAIFGGEHSGHYYFRDNYGADSGLIAALMVIEICAKSAERLSQLRLPFEKYTSSGEINFSVSSPKETIERIKNKYGNCGIDEMDGLSVDCGDYWFNIRPSNTEPLVRLNLEVTANGDEAIKECSRRVEEIREAIGANAECPKECPK